MKCDSETQLNDLCALITSYGVPTGSRVIGGFTEKSDHDYVMTINNARVLYDSLGVEFKLKSLEDYSQLFSSYKYSYFGDEINLIIVDDHIDLDAWDYATQVMTCLDDYTSPSERKKIFGKLLLDYYEIHCQDDGSLYVAARLQRNDKKK